MRFHARRVCAASFPLKLEKLEEEAKGKRERFRDLVGKLGA